MNRPPALATLTLAPALLALVAAAPAAGVTVEERFNKRVAKLAFPLPILTAEGVSAALTKGKAFCVCREDFPGSVENRAGVAVHVEEAGTSPLTRCLVPVSYDAGGNPILVGLCEDWVPLTK
jgi:hypothetical protein